MPMAVLDWAIPVTTMPHIQEMSPNMKIVDSPLGVFELNTLILVF